MALFKTDIFKLDWDGLAGATNAHASYFSKYIVDNNYVSENQYLIGLSFQSFRSDAKLPVKPTVFAYVLDNCTDGETAKALLAGKDKPNVFEVEIDLSFKEFFGLFKEFSIKMERPGFDLINADLEIQKVSSFQKPKED